MKNFNLIVLTILFSCLTVFMKAQDGQFDVRFDLHNIDCNFNKVYVNIDLRANNLASQFNAADQNYRFSFNKNALAVNTVAIDTQYITGNINGSFFDPQTLNGTSDSVVSYNIVMTGGPGLPVDTNWLRIGRLSFDIVDFNECLGFVWHDHQPLSFPPTFISEKVGGVGGVLLECDEGLYIGNTVCPSTINCTSLDSNMVSGNVYRDSNKDCAYTTGEPDLGQQLVIVTGDAQYMRYTDNDGNYNISIDSGSYAITVVPPSSLYENCFPSATFSVNDSDSIVIDIPVKPLVDCPYMDVSMVSSLVRRCMSSNLFVKYCNNGTIPAVNASVDITLDTSMTFQSSTIVPSSQSGNTYSFPLGTVAANDCGTFTIEVLNSCFTIQGQAVCMHAQIFPDTICTPPAGTWDGSITEVQVDCQPDSVQFTIKNIGQSGMDNQLDYFVVEEHIILKSSPFQLTPNQTLIEKFPSNGSTYRIYAEQAEGYFPMGYQPTVAVEGCGTNMAGTFSTGFINDFPFSGNLNTSKEICEVVVGPMDPNDKSATPEGVGVDHLILPDTDINYRIRFQNVGTDTAFNIVIRDTLSQNLDVTSIQQLGASHTYRLDFEGNNILIFTFPDINLVDSTANEPDSHGFVKFKISQQENLPYGTMIYNSAAIYFDFEAPVITNQTFHEVGEYFIQTTTPIDEPGNELNQVTIIPNPFNQFADIVVESSSPYTKKITVCDALGRVVLCEMYEENSYRIYKNQLPTGLYFFSIQDEKNKIKHNGRFMIK